MATFRDGRAVGWVLLRRLGLGTARENLLPYPAYRSVSGNWVGIVGLRRQKEERTLRRRGRLCSPPWWLGGGCLRSALVAAALVEGRYSEGSVGEWSMFRAGRRVAWTLKRALVCVNELAIWRWCMNVAFYVCTYYNLCLADHG